MFRFLHETSQGFTNLARTSLPGIFLAYALIAGGTWNGDVLVADIEELENTDVSEIHPRRINAKEVPSQLLRKKSLILMSTSESKESHRM